MTIKERPILFSAPMVHAILDGRKSQTRRIVKGEITTIGTMDYLNGQPLEGCDVTLGQCPYGKPGDLLWVRETWGAADRWVYSSETNPPRVIAYRADKQAYCFDSDSMQDTSEWGWTGMKWRPSIHMPRWASRITLRVKGVRIERLQAISVEDAQAEGIEVYSYRARFVWRDYGPNPGSFVSPKSSFISLWESINGPASWTANPYVWVIEFELQQEGKRWTPNQ